MKSIKEKALQLYTFPSCGQFGTGDYEEPEFDIDGFNEFMKGANYVLEQIEQLIYEKHVEGNLPLFDLTRLIDKLKEK